MLYEKLLQKVEEGKSYYVDLKKKSLRIGHKYYIKDGEVLVDEDLIESCEEPWNMVSELYKNYKESVPSQRDKGSKYFKALTSEELNDGQMAFNEKRYLAQARLEGFILLASMKGVLQWENDEHWFWHDQNDKELVVLKEWL